MTQEVDTEVFYSVGKILFDQAKNVHDAFDVNVKMLAETSSMAGSDDDGAAWAKSYDQRVAEVLGAVNDLNIALQNYGGVVIQVGYNHAVAEHHATVDAQGPPPGKPELPQSAVSPLSAPPSAGGPGEGLIDSAIGLVAQVGVQIPDGDTEKIDQAAQAWERLATVHQTTFVPKALGMAAGIFTESRTPEDDYIATDIGELRDAANVILDGCAELSQSCKDYKAHLDELRDRLKRILHDLEVELAVTAAIAIASSFVTFGVGAVAATAKAAHTITKFAKLVRDAVTAWKLSKNISRGVTKVLDIPGVRKLLERLKNMGRRRDPRLGPGVRATEGAPLTTSRAQIEKKFQDHANDFGITAPRGRAGFEAFEDAVRRHVDNPSTLHITGTYKGNPAILNYNPETGLVVVQKPTGEFVSGWKLAPEQIWNVLQRGSLT